MLNKMSRRLLFEVILRNDVPTFTSLVQENEDILGHETDIPSNTVLHLASRFGYVELVRKIVRLCPNMVAAENEKQETPMHEACRRGNVEVLSLLLETNSPAAFKLNCKGQSALFMACSNGHLNLVKLLILNLTPLLLDFDDDGIDQNSFFVAESKGYTDIVKELLNVQPNLAWKTDKNGSSPLHYSCSRGHLEITKMLLRLNQGLAVEYDATGYSPLHLVVIMNGKVEILKEFMMMAPASFQFSTKEGETVFHLTVRYNHNDAFMWLEKFFQDTNLINRPDKYGNTILHLAVLMECHQIVIHLINKKRVDINAQNYRGHTALDIIDQAERNSETSYLEGLVIEAGGKRSSELLPHLQVVNGTQDGTLTKSWLTVASKANENHITSYCKLGSFCTSSIQSVINSLMIIASLITTVTFSAIISPPGGVNQEGSHRGQSTVGKTTAFKVFAISNNLAFFLSLSMVVILLGINIPFRRREPIMNNWLLPVSHIIMWTDVSFLAMASVAASLVIMPHGEGTEWAFDALVLSISGGILAFVFVGLLVMLLTPKTGPF